LVTAPVIPQGGTMNRRKKVPDPNGTAVRF
jgi:hypothetical protein